MNDDEVNKIIAEYMGKRIEYWELYKTWIIRCKDYRGKAIRKPITEYTKSIDALVSVWEKLEDIGITFRFDKGEWAQPHGYFLIDSCNDEYGRSVEEDGLTIQQFAAYATAKAIQETGNE